MIFAKGSARKRSSSRVLIATVLFSLVSLLHASIALAQGGGVEQFQRSATIGGRIPSTIFIIGWKHDSRNIEKLLDMLYSRAEQTFSKLNWQSPQSEVSKLNARTGQGPVNVSPEVLAAFEAAMKVAKWSGGACDITFGGKGNYRDINIDRGRSTVELSKSGMRVSFNPIMEGLLADLLIRYIYAANMKNAMVKTGNVFRGLGQAMRGPWRIQVQDDAGIFAHHAVNLTVFDTGVATVSANQYRGIPIIDPRSKSQITPPCKGVVVIMRDAALAQGLAHAAFILGPGQGMDLMSRVNAKGLIVDMNGKFIRSPGFK